MSSQRPKMCPSCGKLMGLERVCPYCGADASALANRMAALASRSPSGGHRVTMVLVVINLALYLLAALLGGQQPAEGGFELLQPDPVVMSHLGSQVPPLVALGEWWRLVMPIFLHLGLLHVAMNTWVLWVTGRQLEREVGGPAFFTMYMAAGIVGFVASQFAEVGGAGASGAVAGVLGCTIVYRRLVDGSFRHPVTAMAIQLVVLNAIFGLAVSKVNNVAHLGGFLTGAVLGLPFARFAGRKVASRVWFGLAGVFGAVVVTALVMTVLNQPPQWIAEMEKSRRCFGVAVQVLDTSNQTVDPANALGAIQCFDALEPMDKEGNDVVAAMRAALVKIRNSRLDGARKGELEGMRDFDVAGGEFVNWITRDPKLRIHAELENYYRQRAEQLRRR